MPNFTKTHLQTRAEGMIKPKNYNAWDILALNDIIKDKIENQKRRLKEHNDRLELRRFYDQQIMSKNATKQSERDELHKLQSHIDEKCRTLDKLTDLDNTKRMLMRG